MTNQEIIIYEQQRKLNITKQETENIRVAALADIQIINANASSTATQVLNRGQGQVAKQDIEYTAKALGQV